MASKSSHGVSRVLVKLENSVRDGNYYEAHQMYRTLHYRYLNQKKYNELLDMLYNGASLFLDYDQQISGADLSILLIEVLVISKNDDYINWVPKVCKIFSKINPSTPERETFLSNAVNWASKDRNYGHPFLHQNIGQIFWNEKNYTQARYHYIHSKDGQGCAKLLIEFQSLQGFKCEADLFIAQAVLQYLCLSNKNTANQTFNSYTEQHPGIKKTGPPYLLPLLNFIWFLLQAVEKQKLQMFAVICEQYEPSIKRDPCYVQYLDKIGQIFFGIQPILQERNRFFGNFLESFLSGFDDESDDESPQASTSNTTRRELIENTELD